MARAHGRDWTDPEGGVEIGMGRYAKKKTERAERRIRKGGDQKITCEKEVEEARDIARGGKVMERRHRRRGMRCFSVVDTRWWP